MIRNSAKALIIHDGHVLAIKKQDEEGFYYILPGGGQEHGESLVDALRRECFEETGAEVLVEDLRFVRDYIGRNHEFAEFDADAHTLELMFICRLAPDSEVGNGHVPDVGQLAVEWLPLNKLDSYRLYPLALRAWITRLTDAATRIYLGDIN